MRDLWRNEPLRDKAILMAKVTPKTLTHHHTRAGRALLQWTTTDLGREAESSAANVRKFEAGGSVSEAVRENFINALQEAGVELLNGNRPGARLMSVKEN